MRGWQARTAGWLVAGVGLLGAVGALAQERPLKDQTVTFTQYIETLTRPSSDSTRQLFLEGTRVRFDYGVDKPGMDAWWANGGHALTSGTGLVNSYNVEFDPEFWLVVRDLTFEADVGFVSCTGLKFLVKDCVFKRGLRFTGNEISFLVFENCRFENGVKFDRNTVADRVEFTNCTFSFAGETESSGFDRTSQTLLISAKNDPIDLRLTGCRFLAPTEAATLPQYGIGLHNSSYTNLRLQGCTFGAPLDLSQSIVANQFTLQQCTLGYGLYSNGLSINQLNALVDWGNLKDYRLRVRDPQSGRVWDGESAFGTAHETQYTLLASCYANFYNTFKSQGNRFAANAAYIELKTIETRQQRQLYTETGSSEAYFIWLMDLFLEEFSDFGTNPIRSIRYSLTVILIFAAIYFLAPVALDERPKRNLYSQLSLYASFINHNRPFEDLYREHLALFQAAEAPDTHRVALRREVQQLPWALRILIPRQVGVRTLFTTLEARFYQLIDQKGDLTWDELSKRKKWTLGLVFWLVAGASIGYFLVLRVIDSVVLSLNVFSTLGFGEIRVRGVAVYLTILEGFLGWFLLSIFSVVLLNQLLQ